MDCVTYICCASVHLDVGGGSIPYIAGWGEDGALDAIREYAQTIDTIARRLEQVVDPLQDKSGAETDDRYLGRLTTTAGQLVSLRAPRIRAPPPNRPGAELPRPGAPGAASQAPSGAPAATGLVPG